MADYAPNYTPRARIKYLAAGLNHSLTVRAPRGSSFADTQGRIGTLATMMTALSPLMADDFAVYAQEVALTDVDVFLPATSPATFPSGSVAIADYSTLQRITSTSWSGKNALGQARFSIFGLFWDIEVDIEAADFVMLGTETSVITTIANAASAAFCSNSGQLASFYPRATLKVNDYWVRQVRKGTVVAVVP